MRIKRKSQVCLNCNRTLDKVYNFCPNCGQKNQNDNVSFGTLVGDFFSTYFAVDSKFSKTVRPFFLKPGYLTNKYVLGKRESYAHPIRLYLIISIFYFFALSTSVQLTDVNEDDSALKISNSYTILDSIAEINPKTRQEILSTLSSRQRKTLENKLQKNEIHELKAFLKDLNKNDQLDIRQAIGDSISNELGLKTNNKTKKNKPITEIEKASDTDRFILERIPFGKLRQLNEDYDLTNEQIYDSLGLKNLGYFDKKVVNQAIKISNSDTKQIMVYVVKNLPLMMLFLIPIFALILKLLYIRRDELYIKHIIHALHLHTFAYLIYGIFAIISILLLNDNIISFLFNMIGFMIVTIYSYMSFKKVYNQKWFKTLVKFIAVGFGYYVAIVTFFVAETIISLLLF